MGENKMNEVADLLGVKIGQEFRIKGINEIYTLFSEGLYWKIEGKAFLPSDSNTILVRLLKGVYEIEKFILTDSEKRYLEIILTPFKDRIINIYKCCWDADHYFIGIDLKDKNIIIDQPCDYYKGMELYKKYSLQELGLFEEEK